MKLFLCFFSIVALIFPLYNFQKRDLFEVEGIDKIYFVEAAGQKQVYKEIEKANVDEYEFQTSQGVMLFFDLQPKEVIMNLNAMIVKTERIEDMEILYAYTNLYSDFIFLDGKQVNVQIVQKADQTIAGFPLILSGF